MGQPADPTAPSRRAIVAWSTVMLAAAGLACFAGSVVIPGWRTRRVVALCCTTADAEPLVRKLGGPRPAARQLRLQLRLPDCIGPQRKHVLWLLAACGKEAAVALPQVLAALDADEDTAVAAADVLATIGDPAAVPALIRVLGPAGGSDLGVPRGRRPGTDRKREAASRALARIGWPAVKALVDSLGAGECGDSTTAPWAAHALWLIGPDSAPALVEALGGPDLCARERAGQVLVALGEPALEVLLPALDDPDPEVRWRAAAALGGIGNRRATARLVAALRDEEVPVRAEAARALGTLADSDAADALIATLREAEPRVRCAAASALGAMRDPRSFAPLIARLEDKDPDMRGAAAEGLGLLGDDRAVEPLGRMLNSGDHRDRSRAVGALLRIGGQRAIALVSGTLRGGEQTTASR